MATQREKGHRSPWFYPHLNIFGCSFLWKKVNRLFPAACSISGFKCSSIDIEIYDLIWINGVPLLYYSNYNSPSLSKDKDDGRRSSTLEIFTKNGPDVLDADGLPDMWSWNYLGLYCQYAAIGELFSEWVYHTFSSSACSFRITLWNVWSIA